VSLIRLLRNSYLDLSRIFSYALPWKAGIMAFDARAYAEENEDRRVWQTVICDDRCYP
jgi:hypothetical protein